MSRTAPFTLSFNSKSEYRDAMLCALAITEAIQTEAHFPSVSITPNWSTGRVEIKIPIGSPLHHERLELLNQACVAHACMYFVVTHRPGGEYFREPYVEVLSLNDDD